MTTIQFYHLTATPLERALPKLVEKAYGAGFRTLLVLESEERLDYVNQLLWTYDQDAFLPHGSHKEDAPEQQPVLLSTSLANDNAANLLFITDGSTLPEGSSYERVLDMFDGKSETAVASARERWKAYKDAGHDMSYFKQTESGSWSKAA